MMYVITFWPDVQALAALVLENRGRNQNSGTFAATLDLRGQEWTYLNVDVMWVEFMVE